MGATPKAPVAQFACVSPTQDSACGPIGSSAEGPGGAVRMRLPHPGQRFVAPSGAPPKATLAQLACVSPT
eukprot:2041118-Pyramimonas_sp.AAC.1